MSAPPPVVRKEQATLTDQEWANFIAAINQLHGIGIPAPRYREFVQVHVAAMDPEGMPWGVHTMQWMGMVGRNFLAWHRWFIARMEARLRLVIPSVSIPYWDWIANPTPPAPLSDPALLDQWSVSRDFDPSQMPQPAELEAVNARVTFQAFQSVLENTAHNEVHRAVGGTMATSSSPADPLFWLHHANVDRIWAVWQVNHPDANPPNMDEILQPPSLFGIPVSSTISVAELGYQYV